jgi:hypothetical protein
MKCKAKIRISGRQCSREASVGELCLQHFLMWKRRKEKRLEKYQDRPGVIFENGNNNHEKRDRKDC